MSPSPSASACSSNQDWIIEQIIRDFEDGVQIVPWIGAGVSVPYGYPSWTSFLKGLANGTEIEAEVGFQLAGGDYEEAAELIHGHVGAQKFEDEFKRAFDRAPLPPPYPTPMREIARLSSQMVVTTNYETVAKLELDREFGDALETPIEGAMIERVRNAIHGTKPKLWMMHGTASERTTRVLMLDEYKLRYEDLPRGSGLPTLPALLDSVFSAKTLLFVGCSLTNDRTMRVMKDWAERVGAGHHHYAILEEPDPSERDERIRFLSERFIRPIFYPQGEHARVQEILAHIANRTQPFVARMRQYGGRLISIMSRRGPGEMPAAPITHYHLDHGQHFEGQALRQGVTWAELAEETRAFIGASTAARVPLRLSLQAHLSLCALAGACLPARIGLPILLEQYPEVWSAEDDRSGPEWPVESLTVGDGHDWALLMEAVPGARHDVVSHLAESLPEVGTLVVLAPLEGHPRLAGGRHAQQLVNAAVRAVQQRQGESRRRPLHAFVVGPWSLAFMLGQQSMALGSVQLYEYLREGRKYVPSILI